MQNINDQFNLWLERATDDPDITTELKEISGNDGEIYERFYKELEFGTGGLRGVIGAGTNRMNVYTVARATQGFSDYLKEKTDCPSVAIAYDSRIKSDVFAKCAASVFAGNGIKVYIYKELMPTPMLSFAVRQLKCDGGVVVTASHNPSKYNGYKAYDENGCQLNADDSHAVISKVEQTDIFDGISKIDFEKGLSDGIIEYISEDLINAYLDRVLKESVHNDVLAKSGLRVVYSPLHGTGNKPVRAILKKAGLFDVTVVKEQELPNGNFPTAPYPNPEIKEAFVCAIKLAKDTDPDILLATDPDCDRVGIAVKYDGDYKLISGNQVGVMLTEYLLRERKALGICPENPIVVKTIVTTGLAEKICDDYGAKTVNVLTGFKYIGEVIKNLEDNNDDASYVLGFEESYGYLSSGYVRDKDAVNASLLICEMAAFYKTQGKSLVEVLENIYEKYGYYDNSQLSFQFEGAKGGEIMKEIMSQLRTDVPENIGGKKVVVFNDYLSKISKNKLDNTETQLTLPSSDVLEYKLEDGSSCVVRPSGTEPKVKIYIETVGDGKAQAELLRENIKNEFSQIMNK